MFFYLNKNFSLFDFSSRFILVSSYSLPKIETAFISVSEKFLKSELELSIPVLFSFQGFGRNLCRFTRIRRAAASFKTRKKDLYGAVSLVHKKAVYELLHSCFTVLVPELVEAGFILN